MYENSFNYKYTGSNFVGRNFSGFLQTNGSGSWATSAFKSMFLDRYGAHFTAAQYNIVSQSLGRLVYNTSPDVITLTETSNTLSLIPKFAFSSEIFKAGSKVINPYANIKGRPVTRDGI